MWGNGFSNRSGISGLRHSLSRVILSQMGEDEVILLPHQTNSDADKNLHGYFLEYQIHMDIILENIHVDSDFQYAVEL